MFRAYYQNGTEVQKGDILYTSGDPWIYDGCFHPRKISVHWDKDDKDDPVWPNRMNREYYASVFGLGIWDDKRKEWTFEPKVTFTPNAE